jgi:large subunit ribosomal protein L39
VTRGLIAGRFGVVRRHIALSAPKPSAAESTATVTNNAASAKLRSEMFSQEKKRQLQNIPRLEKIEVLAKVVPQESTLLLNKGMSTPFDVARRKHI